MWLNGLTIVTPDGVIDKGAIAINDGQISTVSAKPVSSHCALDYPGLWAIPGLIDLHGDALEHEIEPRPGSLFPVEIALLEMDKRLAACGITTAYSAVSFADFSVDEDPEQKPMSLRVEESARNIIQVINTMRRHLMTDVRVHARFELTHPNAGPVLTDLIEQEQVQMVSLMDHSPGQGQFRDVEGYVRYMVKWLGAERSSVERMVQRLGQMKQETAPLRTLRAISRLAQEHGLILSSHDDDTEDKVALMGDLGATISEFPITTDAAHAAKSRGMWVAMGAPNALRGRSHSGNLSALDALTLGALDILLSDYYPPALLHAPFSWAEQGLLPIHEAIKLVSTHPAQAVGMLHTGALVEGKQADLVIVDPEPLPRVVATMRAGRFIFQSAR